MEKCETKRRTRKRNYFLISDGYDCTKEDDSPLAQWSKASVNQENLGSNPGLERLFFDSFKRSGWNTAMQLQSLIS